jgi:outer membrane protein assembly factor BamE
MAHHIVTPFAMLAPHRYPFFAGLIVTASMVLAGCTSTSATLAKLNPVDWVTPYRADVVQGNFISNEQVQLLRQGMSRGDVRNVLGTPLVTSVFHGDRWDYVFTLRRQGVPAQAFRYAVFFKGDLLDRFEGDTMPSESEFIAKMDTRRKLGKVPVLEATPAQMDAATKNAPAKSAASPEGLATTAPTAPAAPALASYPPLESPRQ